MEYNWMWVCLCERMCIWEKERASIFHSAMFGRKLSLAKKEQFASYMQVVMSYFGHESESEIDIDFET